MKQKISVTDKAKAITYGRKDSKTGKPENKHLFENSAELLYIYNTAYKAGNETNLFTIIT